MDNMIADFTLAQVLMILSVYSAILSKLNNANPYVHNLQDRKSSWHYYSLERIQKSFVCMTLIGIPIYTCDISKGGGTVRDRSKEIAMLEDTLKILKQGWYEKW